MLRRITEMNESIYQQLWDLDLQHNGCSVTARGPDGNWTDPDADIKLDEQRELSSPGQDNAPNPLIAGFNSAKLEGPTYSAFKALMNNYVFNARSSEDHLGDNEVEDKERDVFLDTIMETAVMKHAHGYITDELEIALDQSEFRTTVQRLWFEVYTNHYNNTPVAFCCGFEHIIVGESKGNPQKLGIGGYHSWTKYLWDQESHRVDYKGYNYDNQFNRLSPQGSKVPHVVTLSMSYTPLDMDGQPMTTKRKDMGGFFVGPSPELQIAIPVVAFFESEKKLFFVGNGSTARERNEKEIQIHDAVYRLVLYRETRPDQSRGNRLRSFFPKLIKLKSGNDIVDDTLTADKQGDLAIVRILANPFNPEDGREWVEVENRSDKILQLDGWTLTDHRERKEQLFQSLNPGKRMRVMITRASQQSMQLTNSGGTVSVFNQASALISKVTYPRSADGEILVFS